MNYVKEAMNIKSVRRTINIFAVLSLLVLATPFSISNTFAAADNNTCFDRASANANITQQGSSVVATFRVPQKCNNSTHRVSFVVYKVNDGNWMNRVNNQYVDAAKTINAGVGQHRITLPIPSCAYQADLVKGGVVNISTGAQNGPHLDAKVGGNHVPCKAKPAPPTPPKPTPPAPTPPAPVRPTPPAPTPPSTTVNNNNVNNNTNTVTVQTASAGSTDTGTTSTSTTTTEEATADTSTSDTVATTTVADESNGKLADTGPGNVAGAVVGISSISALVYNLVIRRRLGLNS